MPVRNIYNHSHILETIGGTNLIDLSFLNEKVLGFMDYPICNYKGTVLEAKTRILLHSTTYTNNLFLNYMERLAVIEGDIFPYHAILYPPNHEGFMMVTFRYSNKLHPT